ncbi:MAG: 3-deoxy-D-manno-octulosonic acid transferase [SAR324 cluster bacterium]|nr:3-deoxy-D-manno-octulosonic acid transferase [SAR324 cluster bacterium]
MKLSPFQKFWSTLYNLLFLPVAWILVKIVSMKSENLRESLQGRKDLWTRIGNQLARREWKKPLIWFHVASAGEYLQAQPLMELCKTHDVEFAVTYTSVNALKWLKKINFSETGGAVMCDYLPLDYPYFMRRLLALIQPSAIVYIKFDLWPNLLWEAYRQNIPQYLVSASVSPDSGKVNSFLGRSFFQSLYPCLEQIFTVTETDRQLLENAGANPEQLLIAGNTRIDSVIYRRDRIPVPHMPCRDDQFVFIAGSSWPPDEKCMVPVLLESLKQNSRLMVIMVPHEPTESHLAPLEQMFQAWKPVRWSQWHTQNTDARVVLVDTVGVLSSLYHKGHLAYIGGGFTTGIHNIMEPCAMGVPVIFGPKYHNAPEALDLISQGLVFSVETTEEFRKIFNELLGSPELTKNIGHQLREYVESASGASKMCFEIILERCEMEEPAM